MVYCDYYKFLLVEELLLGFPEQFHYGKCSVIGRFSIDEDSLIFLNNIKINSINSKYQLNDGELQLKTVWNVCDKIPAYGQPVEVYGEAVLLKGARTTRSSPELPRNIKDAYEELKTVDPEQIPLFWELLQKEYQPALKIHSYRFITQPSKLIDCNLRLRIVSSGGFKKSDSVTSSTDSAPGDGNCQKHV